MPFMKKVIFEIIVIGVLYSFLFWLILVTVSKIWLLISPILYILVVLILQSNKITFTILKYSIFLLVVVLFLLSDLLFGFSIGVSFVHFFYGITIPEYDGKLNPAFGLALMHFLPLYLLVIVSTIIPSIVITFIRNTFIIRGRKK